MTEDLLLADFAKISAAMPSAMLPVMLAPLTRILATVLVILIVLATGELFVPQKRPR